MDVASRRFRPLKGPLPVGFGVATALGVALGLIGPFGSYLNGGALQRIAYWTVNLWVGWLVFGHAMSALSRLAASRAWPVLAWTPPAVAILALLPAVTSRLLAVWIWPVTRQVGWLEWYGQCLMVSALAALLIQWRIGAARSQARTTLAADPRDRLPPALGREILCLQMEDHYVRIHTPRGSTLLMMSMAQAVAGLKEADGLQTHRSWWVARGAVEGVVEEGRNLRLRLIGGLEAPVARARVGALRAAGWLPGAAGPDPGPGRDRGLSRPSP